MLRQVLEGRREATESESPVPSDGGDSEAEAGVREPDPYGSLQLLAVFAFMIYDALAAVSYFFALFIVSVVVYNLGQACY